MGQLMLQPGARILFQGDSITDAGRSREDETQLGTGYVNFLAAWLSALYPERRLTFNRGTGGNRVYDMEATLAGRLPLIELNWIHPYRYHAYLCRLRSTFLPYL